MKEIVVRFLIGGAVVSSFATLGDLLKPKRFAGLFGAAPSVALATLALTVAKDGRSFASIEGRSMVAGAVAFFIYAFIVCQTMMRYKPSALVVSLSSLGLWLTAALSLWFTFLR